MVEDEDEDVCLVAFYVHLRMWHPIQLFRQLSEEPDQEGGLLAEPSFLLDRELQAIQHRIRMQIKKLIRMMTLLSKMMRMMTITNPSQGDVAVEEDEVEVVEDGIFNSVCVNSKIRC